LKNRFGEGYQLTLVKKNREPNPALVNFVSDMIENSKMIREISSEIQFELPSSASSHFKNFFSELDQRSESLGVENYSVGFTTLEDVFLRFANASHGNVNVSEDNEDSSHSTHNQAPIVN
jgi:hypothetical protein